MTAADTASPEPGSPDPTSPDPGSPEGPVEIRFLQPDEAELLTEAIVRGYGRTYDAEWVYDPGEIRARLESGRMRSLVGLHGGDVVAHLALQRPAADAPSGHAGQGVVDPRWRGHHLFTDLKRELAAWCCAEGMLGIASEATAAHPYSQAANLELGGHETGFLLGYIPAQVSSSAMRAGSAGHRQSVALFWLSTNPVPARPVHAPPWHVDILTRLYAHNEIPRQVATGAGGLPARPTRLHVVDRPDHNEATVVLDALGADVVAALGAALEAEAAQGRDVVYVELALDDPHTAALPLAVHDELGVSFGGVVPVRDAGDVLVLQWLDRVETHAADVAVASDFGAELLAYVFERARA